VAEPYNRGVPRILAVASSVDLDFRYGCTPAWWQLWKGLYESGVDLVVTPYRGRAIESPWWRTAPNPSYRLGETYAGLRDGLARLKGDRYSGGRGVAGGKRARPGYAGDDLRVVTPRWQRHLERLVEQERPDAVIVFTVPMAHFRESRVPSGAVRDPGRLLRRRRADEPPEFGAWTPASTTTTVPIPPSTTSSSPTPRGSAAPRPRRATVETIFWAADPEFFRPLAVEKEYDVFFYGYGDKFRREWMASLIGEPSRMDPSIDVALGGRDFRATGAHAC
jgi:hypothetical protein